VKFREWGAILEVRRWNMRERVVVALDGSKVGESAIPYVADLLSKLSPEVDREVILLQVLSPVTVTHSVAGEVVPDISASEKEMQEHRQKALDYLDWTGESLRGRGAMVTARAAVGDAAEQIVSVAEEVDANLIAMSTHGRSGLSRWAFGSVTDKVLRLEGRIPIIVIRAQQLGSK
jgi:nucleotide-binding universal stress UspA family protein